MAAAVEIIVRQQSQVVEQPASTIGERRGLGNRVDFREQVIRIVTAQSVGAVDHEQNPTVPAGFANRFPGGLDQMIEGFGKIGEVVLQRTSQLLLVGGVRVDGIADLGKQPADERETGLDSCARSDALRELPGRLLTLDTFEEPCFELLQVNAIQADTVILELLRQLAGEVQRMSW